MNSVFCVLLFVGYCFAQNFSTNAPSGNSGSVNTTNTNTTEYFERPCPVYDIHCIRQYFGKHGKCKITYGPVPEPYYRAQTTVFLPYINITVTLLNIKLNGLNGRIEEFYINRETDKLVMAIEFRGLTFNSNDTYFRFHRRAREPIVTSDFFFVVYESIVMTIIIPNLKNLQLERSEVFTYAYESRPKYTYGSGINKTKDPTAKTALAEFNGNTKFAVREAFLTEGTFYPTTFIQWNICDFGLQLL